MQADAIRRARREAIAIDRLAARLRLASFRGWMQTTVSRMSSLVPALLEGECVALEDALMRLRPSPAWKAVTRSGSADGGGAHTRSLKHFYLGMLAGVSQVLPTRGDVQGELVLRRRASTPGRTAVNVVGHRIEIAIQGPAHQLATANGVGRLLVKLDLPETVAVACVGRPLEEITDVPLLAGRGLTVDGAQRHAGGWVFGFAVDCVTIDLPWSDSSAR